MEDTRQSVSNAEEIDLLKLAKSVWRKRAFILKVATAGAVVGLVVAFSIPREYTTTVKMAPEGVKTSAAGGMADLAAMAGINLSGQNQSGDGINLMLYPDIVSSTPFIVEMSQIPGKRDALAGFSVRLCGPRVVGALVESCHRGSDASDRLDFLLRV